MTSKSSSLGKFLLLQLSLQTSSPELQLPSRGRTVQARYNKMFIVLLDSWATINTIGACCCLIHHELTLFIFSTMNCVSPQL